MYVGTVSLEIEGAGGVQQRVHVDVDFGFPQQVRDFASAFPADDVLESALETFFDSSATVFAVGLDPFPAQRLDVLLAGFVEDVILADVLGRFFDDDLDLGGAFVRKPFGNGILFAQTFDHDAFQFGGGMRVEELVGWEMELEGKREKRER